MIRVGIGGWTFAPWRETFYPREVKAAGELAYASRKVTTIEINGTFYRTQSAASFAKWRDETPEGFVFAVKGHRNVTNRPKLAEAEEAVAWFLRSGILELGDKLGPILWQLPHYKRFDADDMAAFLALLPAQLDGQVLRHAVEPRQASFVEAGFVEMARRAGVAIVYADNPKYPQLADPTAAFIYARLQNAAAAEAAGYPGSELDQWAARARQWQAGGAAEGLLTLVPPQPSERRDVFIYMINGAKERAPAAAMALLQRL